MILISVVFLVLLVVFFRLVPQDSSPPGTYPLKLVELPAQRNGIQFNHWPNPLLTYQGIETTRLFFLLKQPDDLPEMMLIQFFQPGHLDSPAVDQVWRQWQAKGMRRLRIILSDSVSTSIWHFVHPHERAQLVDFMVAIRPDTSSIQTFTLLYLKRYPRRLYFTAGPMDTKSVNLFLTREFRGQF